MCFLAHIILVICQQYRQMPPVQNRLFHLLQSRLSMSTDMVSISMNTYRRHPTYLHQVLSPIFPLSKNVFRCHGNGEMVISSTDTFYGRLFVIDLSDS